MCSGVVPQQPPTKLSPNSPTKPDRASASSSGVSGYSAPFLPSTGRPAFGITETGIVECRDRCRRCSLISAGPVAQFRPIMSMPSGSSAVSAAPISDPSSIVPVVSTVTCTMIGIRRSSSSIAMWQPRTAALDCRMSWQVSMRKASAPPSSMPRAASAYASRITSNEVWPSVGSLVPGPIEPRTKRGVPSAANSSATRRAIATPFSDSSRMRSAMS